MKTLFVLIKKDVLEQARSRKFLVTAIVCLFIALFSPISAKLIPQIFSNMSIPGITVTIPEATYRDALDQYVKNLSQIGVLVFIFVSASSVADEKAKRTLEMLLVKPVSRQYFILSKFKSYFLTTSLTFIGGSIIFYLYTVSIFGTFSALHTLILAGMLLIYTLLVITTTIFFSTIARSSLLAVAGGFLGYIVYSIVLSLFKVLAPYSPSYIINNYKELFENGWNSSFLPPIIVSLVLMMTFVFLSVISFKKQEIER